MTIKAQMAEDILKDLSLQKQENLREIFKYANTFSAEFNTSNQGIDIKLDQIIDMVKMDIVDKLRNH